MPALPRKRTALLAGLAIGLGFAGLVAFDGWRDTVRRAAYTAPTPAYAERATLAGSIAVAGQLGLDDLSRAAGHGYRTVIALRPDGEASDQPSAALMRARASSEGLAFHYVPVPQGELPDAVAERLGEALAASPGPVLLYCRSGRRAVRAWAVAEAARPGGLDPAAIRAAAAGAGHPVDDLAERLDRRLAQRSAAPGTGG